MLNYRRVNFLDLATCKNPIHAFHKDGLVILLILRQLRQQRAGMQNQRGLPQHLVDLAAPQVPEMELMWSQTSGEIYMIYTFAAANQQFGL